MKRLIPLLFSLVACGPSASDVNTGPVRGKKAKRAKGKKGKGKTAKGKKGKGKGKKSKKAKGKKGGKGKLAGGSASCNGEYAHTVFSCTLGNARRVDSMPDMGVTNNPFGDCAPNCEVALCSTTPRPASWTDLKWVADAQTTTAVDHHGECQPFVPSSDDFHVGTCEAGGSGVSYDVKYGSAVVVEAHDHMSAFTGRWAATCSGSPSTGRLKGLTALK